MRNISKPPSISGVEPGNTVSLDVTIGLTYDKIHFKFSRRHRSKVLCDKQIGNFLKLTQRL